MRREYGYRGKIVMVREVGIILEGGVWTALCIS